MNKIILLIGIITLLVVTLYSILGYSAGINIGYKKGVSTWEEQRKELVEEKNLECDLQRELIFEGLLRLSAGEYKAVESQ